MKICILTSVHPVFNVRVFCREAKTLENAGHEVTLIACHNKEETVEGVRIIPVPFPGNRFSRVFFTTLRIFILALRQNAHVYHFHDPELIPAGLFLKLFKRARVIYDVHEDFSSDIIYYKKWIPGSVKRPLAVFVNIVEKKISACFDCIITATPKIMQNFKHPYVVNINNYPVPDYFKTLPYRNSNRSQNEYAVFYSGEICAARGVEEIVKSLELINPKYRVKLTLLGKFLDSGFYKKISSLKSWNKVIYLEWMPYSDAIRHLYDSDFGLVFLSPDNPSFAYAMPAKMFEYMAAGLPVIGFNFPLWKEIIEGNGCGICIDKLTAENIAQALEYLMSHPQETDKMRENARKAFLEKYNWGCEAKKLLEVYENLAKKQ